MKPNFALLERVAKHTEKIPPKQFVMSTDLEERHCGTVGCSLGWWNHDHRRGDRIALYGSGGERKLRLTTDEFIKLFFILRATPKHQARRIRKFIAKKKASAK